MKIANSIITSQFDNFKNLKSKQLKQDKNITFNTSNINYASIPSTKDYLAFLGGYSLDLSKTYEQLEDSDYPNLKIKEDIKKELDNKNPNNKTLCDIHNARYKGVLDCFSLDELKEKYPEFKDVLSSYDVTARKDSFIDEFQQGKSNVFSPDEDLTLQLIKLYYGQGLSLNDLDNYIAENSKGDKTTKLYYTLTKKLNIPLMSIRYSKVLKLSDKDYNKKFTDTLSLKKRQALEAKVQLAEGEAVIIPSGKLSEAHKKHISDGLIEYFSNNPEQKDKCTRALLYAWNNTKEGQSVKKYLTRFFRKYNTKINEAQLTMAQDTNEKQNSILEEFWKRNSWAKEKWSKALTDGWEYSNSPIFNYLNNTNSEDGIYVYNIVANQAREAVAEFARENGNPDGRYCGKCAYSIRPIDEVFIVNPKHIKYFERTQEQTSTEYDKQNPGFSDEVASLLQLNIMYLFGALNQEQDAYPLPDKMIKDERMIASLVNAISHINSSKIKLFTLKPTIVSQKSQFIVIPVQGVETKDILNFYNLIVDMCIKNNHPEMIDYLNNTLDDIYEKAHLNNKRKTNVFIG